MVPQVLFSPFPITVSFQHPFYGFTAVREVFSLPVQLTNSSQAIPSSSPHSFPNSQGPGPIPNPDMIIVLSSCSFLIGWGFIFILWPILMCRVPCVGAKQAPSPFLSHPSHCIGLFISKCNTYIHIYIYKTSY